LTVIIAFKMVTVVFDVNPAAGGHANAVLDTPALINEYNASTDAATPALRIFVCVPEKGGNMPARCHESTLVHKGRVFALHRDRITLPNGVATTLDVIRHPGASAIVPLTVRGHVLLIRQYRYAIDDHIWEIPAGTMEPGESPLACARRELAEEIGMSADRWHKVAAIAPLPAYSDETIHIYRAEDLVPAEQHLDQDEILEIHEFRYEEALEMIMAGRIRDAKTITGLMMARSVTA
jgi:ADP-ribose pyrophosphatase